MHPLDVDRAGAGAGAGTPEQSVNESVAIARRLVRKARRLVRKGLDLLLEMLIFARQDPRDARPETAQTDEGPGPPLRQRLVSPDQNHALQVLHRVAFLVGR